MKQLTRMLIVLLAVLTVSDIALAQRRGGGFRGGGMRGGGFRGGGFQSRAMARPSINARPAARPSPRRADVRRDFGRADVSRRVDRRTDINRDINIDRDIDVDRGDWWDDGCCHRHPVARAAAWTAGAAAVASAVGSTVYALPSACSAVVVDGITYYDCSGTWYQPQFMGTTTEYVVVSPPN